MRSEERAVLVVRLHGIAIKGNEDLTTYEDDAGSERGSEKVRGKG